MRSMIEDLLDRGIEWFADSQRREALLVWLALLSVEFALMIGAGILFGPLAVAFIFVASLAAWWGFPSYVRSRERRRRGLSKD